MQIKPIERIADDDPINVNLLAMGFKRAPPTKVGNLPVNRWTYSERKETRLHLKPNWRGKYVASLVEWRNGHIFERRIATEPFDDPYVLATVLLLEGDGDVFLGAQRQRRF